MSGLLSFRYEATRWLTIFSVATALSVSAREARAQQAVPATIRLSPEDLERGLNGHQHNFYFLPPGKTGEDYQNAGFFGGKLRPYLAGNARAVRELDNYKRQKTAYLIDKAALVGGLGLYGSQVFSHGDPVYFNGAQAAAAGVVVASLVATIFINRHTNQYLLQAVDNYNTDRPAKHGTLWPRLRPTSLGLGASASARPMLALRWQL